MHCPHPGFLERDHHLSVVLPWQHTLAVDERRPKLRVHGQRDAQLALVPRFVGDQVALGVWRNESRIELQLVLTEAQDQ